MKVVLKNKSGFTILELMLVMALLVIIAMASREVYNGFALGANIDNVSKTIIFDLRSARSSAMNGQDSYNWGVHFVNATSTSDTDYYEIFSTPTNYASTTKKTTVFLSNGIGFSTPSVGTTLDIIFTSLSGTSSAANIIVTSVSNQKTVSVNSEGLVN